MFPLASCCLFGAILDKHPCHEVALSSQPNTSAELKPETYIHFCFVFFYSFPANSEIFLDEIGAGKLLMFGASAAPLAPKLHLMLMRIC